MSRYEPPLPIKKREQEKALEKVREMTNGGSKGNQSPREVQENLNLQRKGLIKEYLQRFVPNVKEIIEKDCTKLLLEEIEKELHHPEIVGEFLKKIKMI